MLSMNPRVPSASLPNNTSASQVYLAQDKATLNQSVGVCEVEGKNYLQVDGEIIRSLSDFQKTSLVNPEHFLDHPLVKEYLDSIQVAEQQNESGDAFKVLSWNVNLCLGRLEAGNGLAHQTHPHYRMENRKIHVWTMLAEIVKLQKPDIICLQELRDFLVDMDNPETKKNFVLEFSTFLDKLGYEVVFEKVDPSIDWSFNLMTARRKDCALELIKEETKPIRVTVDGKPFGKSFPKEGSEEEKGAFNKEKFRHNLSDITCKSILETAYKSPDGVITHVLNLHSGLNSEHKKAYGKKLGERMAEIRQADPNARVVAMGDMNTFEEDRDAVIDSVLTAGAVSNVDIHHYDRWNNHKGESIPADKASSMTMDPFDFGYQPTKAGQDAARSAETDIRNAVKGEMLPEAKKLIWDQNSKAVTPATHPVSGVLDRTFSSGFDAGRSSITIYNKPVVNTELEASELTDPKEIRESMGKADYGKLKIGLFGSRPVLPVNSSLFAADHHPLIASLMPFDGVGDRARY
ncbi:hypothetical protein [Endozoicomonas ascidiicola]|uniref:hypothetical protein n=1 Tax=Endozoicomonas ascidiicola TaxID=1698521 RepID=UPI000833BBBA|nr:hypothetical protein [Endozoicomonas ascidiicola]